MTLKEALVLSLEVWEYLAEHPEIEKKRDLPKELYVKIENMYFDCPLCEYFCGCNSLHSGRCTLVLTVEGKNIDCFESIHPYQAWFHASFDKGRRESATAIVKLLEAALEKEAEHEKEIQSE